MAEAGRSLGQLRAACPGSLPRLPAQAASLAERNLRRGSWPKAEPAWCCHRLNSGEISRDLVADVSVAALFDAKARNKVVEIVESDKNGNAKSGIFNGLKM